MVQNLSMVRGDSASFNIELVDYTEDLASAYLTIRKGFEEPIIVQKSLGDGISKIETGLYVVRIAPEDTASLVFGKYFYDVQIGTDSDVFTILRGIVQIEPDVTY